MPPRFGRIGDWSNDADERDEQSDENNDKRESWFAGGERSGISVQNPNRRGDAPSGNLVRDLLQRASEGGPPPQEPESGGGFRVFSGGGHTLGSDDVPSSYIADPNAPEQEEDVARRTITLWQDGFQIEDGELMHDDDPEHAQILADLIAGNAPISVLNVRPGQPVELRINPRQQELYRPSAGVRAFRGSGQRLGAPVPDLIPGSSTMPGSFSPPARPTTSVQVRLADGTRLVCRMNLNHTIGDIRNFINASRPENVARPYTIGTTFPNRILEDDAATIESAGLVNSVVVQRWV
ncbi:ubiquitin-like protein [Macrolepiota fuliginosa MF-IS2]|uniref:Ubiquitin-like protein n=1 Tax=Macrolepiota fuliginosa MF-IS2 TaxID=1400762 RepID=A0A9P5X2F7_9AGAR|nr:ubiquitin-like protein [Macrolepiota fuliginosa MF-IS2]